MKRRGNPNFSKSADLKCWVKETAFEKLLKKLGIHEPWAAKSPQVRDWVEKHYRKRYVPEWLLEKLHIDISKIGLGNLHDLDPSGRA